MVGRGNLREPIIGTNRRFSATDFPEIATSSLRSSSQRQRNLMASDKLISGYLKGALCAQPYYTVSPAFHQPSQHCKWLNFLLTNKNHGHIMCVTTEPEKPVRKRSIRHGKPSESLGWWDQGGARSREWTSEGGLNGKPSRCRRVPTRYPSGTRDGA